MSKFISLFLFLFLMFLVIFFMCGYFGVWILVFHLLFSFMNLSLFIFYSFYKNINGLVHMKSFVFLYMCGELLCELLFFLGMLTMNYFFYIFMFLHKLGMFPFVFYVILFSDGLYFTEFSSSNGFVFFMFFNKLWGLVLIQVLPICYNDVLFFCMISLLFLFFFHVKKLYDFFSSLLMLDGLVFLFIVISISPVFCFFYLLLSLLILLKSFNVLSGYFGFFDFFCFLLLTGMPLHPLVFLKFYSTLGISLHFVSYLMVFVLIYIKFIFVINTCFNFSFDVFSFNLFMKHYLFYLFPILVFMLLFTFMFLCFVNFYLGILYPDSYFRFFFNESNFYVYWSTDWEALILVFKIMFTFCFYFIYEFDLTYKPYKPSVYKKSN